MPSPLADHGRTAITISAHERASPDCTDHSKAKGGKPIRNRKRRALAWVVKRWAGQVRPRVIPCDRVGNVFQRLLDHP